MCKLSERQLERLRPLLDDRTLDAIAEAKRIPGRNQAKSRQEGFVAKMLREELDEADQALLEVNFGRRGSVGGISLAVWQLRLLPDARCCQSSSNLRHPPPANWVELSASQQLHWSPLSTFMP